MDNLIIRMTLEISKDMLPFVVCIFTFILLLFAFKTLFRVHRNNPLPYVVSLFTTIVMYYLFIYVFKLSRTDYFLTGAKMLTHYFLSFGSYLFALLITIVKGLQSVNIFTMFSLLEFSDTFFAYFRIIGIETCAYITLNVSYKFKESFYVFKKYVGDKVSSFTVYTFKANQINCVYTC